jgi:hypothetical protein
MSQAPTYNKAYLQSLHANKNSLIVDQLYQGLVDEVFNASVAGKTSYTFDMLLLQMPKDRVFPEFNAPPIHHMMMHPMMRSGLVGSMGEGAAAAGAVVTSNPTIRYPLRISRADLVTGLQAKFPDCQVTLIGDENTPVADSNDHSALSVMMNEYRQGTYVCKSGVLIDWS